MSTTVITNSAELRAGLASVLPLVATDKACLELCKVNLTVRGTNLLLQSTDRYVAALWVGELSSNSLDGLQTMLDVALVKDLLALFKDDPHKDAVLTFEDGLLSFVSLMWPDKAVAALVGMERSYPNLASLFKHTLGGESVPQTEVAWGKSLLTKMIKAFGPKAQLTFRSPRDHSKLVVVTSQDHPRLAVMGVHLADTANDDIEANLAVKYISSM